VSDSLLGSREGDCVLHSIAEFIKQFSHLITEIEFPLFKILQFIGFLLFIALGVAYELHEFRTFFPFH
jgi:hypothetical protein